MTEDDVRETVEQAPLIELAGARPPEFSDEALALRFARLNRDELRYVAAWSQWFTWVGPHWKPDDTLAAFDRARAVCRSAAADAEVPHIRTALASAKTVAAVERLAKADRRIATTVQQWDANTDFYNTEKEPMTIDLRSAEQRPPRPSDYMTQAAPVAPAGDCPCGEPFSPALRTTTRTCRATSSASPATV